MRPSNNFTMIDVGEAVLQFFAVTNSFEVEWSKAGCLQQDWNPLGQIWDEKVNSTHLSAQAFKTLSPTPV